MNRHISGIGHKRKSTPERMTVGGKKVKIDKCTEERVRLQESGDYCKMCYAGMKNRNMTAKQKVKKSNKSKMGCGWYQVLICETCWPDYEHTL